MVEFLYNNMKNAGKEYISFKFYFGYYLYIFYKQDFDPHFKSKVANKLTKKLGNLLAIFRKNF